MTSFNWVGHLYQYHIWAVANGQTAGDNFLQLCGNAWNAYRSPLGRRCHRHSSGPWCNYVDSLGTALSPLNRWSDLRRELHEQEGKQQRSTVNKCETTSSYYLGKKAIKYIQQTHSNCTGKQFISQNEMKSHLWTFSCWQMEFRPAYQNNMTFEKHFGEKGKWAVNRLAKEAGVVFTGLKPNRGNNQQEKLLQNTGKHHQSTKHT